MGLGADKRFGAFGAPNSAERELIYDLDGITTVLELGNKKNKNGLYKNWYVQRGLTYTSLDWNGQDGALPIDLNQWLQDVSSIGGPFDLVTNFGTTEHVSNQLVCWLNVHNFVKLGGKFVSTVGIGPNWDDHGFWFPPLEWYDEFASLNGYVVEESKIIEWSPRRNIAHVRMKKVEQKFFSFPQTQMYRSTKQFSQEPRYVRV